MSIENENKRKKTGADPLATDGTRMTPMKTVARRQKSEGPRSARLTGPGWPATGSYRLGAGFSRISIEFSRLFPLFPAFSRIQFFRRTEHSRIDVRGMIGRGMGKRGLFGIKAGKESVHSSLISRSLGWIWRCFLAFPTFKRLISRRLRGNSENIFLREGFNHGWTRMNTDGESDKRKAGKGWLRSPSTRSQHSAVSRRVMFEPRYLGCYGKSGTTALTECAPYLCRSPRNREADCENYRELSDIIERFIAFYHHLSHRSGPYYRDFSLFIGWDLF